MGGGEARTSAAAGGNVDGPDLARLGVGGHEQAEQRKNDDAFDHGGRGRVEPVTTDVGQRCPGVGRRWLAGDTCVVYRITRWTR